MPTYTAFEENDVLLAKIPPRTENGKFAVARGLIGGRDAGSTEFHVLRPSRGISAQLLLYRLLHSDLRHAARMKMKGAAGQLRVPPEFLAEFPFNVPLSREQDRIVDQIEELFSDLEAAVAALERVQANLKRYRASVLTAACDGRLVPTEEELARKEGRTYETGNQPRARILRSQRRDHLIAFGAHPRRTRRGHPAISNSQKEPARPRPRLTPRNVPKKQRDLKSKNAA